MSTLSAADARWTRAIERAKASTAARQANPTDANKRKEDAAFRALDKAELAYRKLRQADRIKKTATTPPKKDTKKYSTTPKPGEAARNRTYGRYK